MTEVNGCVAVVHADKLVWKLVLTYPEAVMGHFFSTRLTNLNCTCFQNPQFEIFISLLSRFLKSTGIVINCKTKWASKNFLIF